VGGGLKTTCNTSPLAVPAEALAYDKRHRRGLAPSVCQSPVGSTVCPRLAENFGPSPEILGRIRPDRPARDVRASLAQLVVSSKGPAPECRQPSSARRERVLSRALCCCTPTHMLTPPVATLLLRRRLAATR